MKKGQFTKICNLTFSLSTTKQKEAGVYSRMRGELTKLMSLLKKCSEHSTAISVFINVNVQEIKRDKDDKCSTDQKEQRGQLIKI